jgi:NAD(P)H-hydrate epimerase
MHLPLFSAEEASRRGGLLEAGGAPELWVDCVLGTGFKGSLRGELAHELELFGEMIRSSTAPVVALDLPSGLDADTGEVEFAHIRADFTLSFGALKMGFRAPGALLKLGEVAVLPLGAPLA